MHQCNFKFKIEFEVDVSVEHDSPFSRAAEAKALALLEEDPFFQFFNMKATFITMDGALLKVNTNESTGT